MSATGGEGSEGIESKAIMYIYGGYIEVTSYDDALNSASHMYINGGYIYAVATGNDAIDSNGNMYLNNGCHVFCCGSEEGLDANSEERDPDTGEKYKVTINNGTYLMCIGGNMGAIESGAQLSQDCYQGSVSANTWYGLKNGNSVAFAAYTPTFSSQGGPGGWPGGGQTSKTMVVTAPSTPTLYSGVTGSGTSFWTGKGYTSFSGGSNVSLSSYSGSGGGFGPGF